MAWPDVHTVPAEEAAASSAQRTVLPASAVKASVKDPPTVEPGAGVLTTGAGGGVGSTVNAGSTGVPVAPVRTPTVWAPSASADGAVTLPGAHAVQPVPSNAHSRDTCVSTAIV